MIKIICKNRVKDYKLTVETTYDSLQKTAKEQLYNSLKDGEFYQENDEIVYPYSDYVFIDAELNNEKTLFNIFGNCDSENIVFKDADTFHTTDMNSMFKNCKFLKSLNLSSFNTSNTTDMSNMFYSCISLKHLKLNNFNTSNVMDMFSMFDWCFELVSLDLSSFDFSKVNNAVNMFCNCESLTDLKFGKNLKVSLNLNESPLTHESAMSVIDGLAEVKEQQTLTFSQKTYNTLTAENIKLATDKNWRIKTFK